MSAHDSAAVAAGRFAEDGIEERLHQPGGLPPSLDQSAGQGLMIRPFQRKQLRNPHQGQLCGLDAVQDGGRHLWRQKREAQVLPDDFGMKLVRISQFFDAAIRSIFQHAHPLRAND